MATQTHKKRPWSAPLGDFVAGAIDGALAKQGFGQADIILRWGEIVGPRLASLCEPIKLQRIARGAKQQEPATLLVRVEGPFALELQHMTAIVVERINAHLGWRCVGRIAMRQGPLEQRRAAPRQRAPSAEAVAAAALSAAPIDDAALRDAVARLGARVLTRL